MLAPQPVWNVWIDQRVLCLLAASMVVLPNHQFRSLEAKLALSTALEEQC